MVKGVCEDVHHLSYKLLIVVVRVSKARSVNDLEFVVLVIKIDMNMKTHRKVLTSPQPLASANGGLLRAGVEIVADLESAVVLARVATEQGVGK